MTIPPLESEEQARALPQVRDAVGHPDRNRAILAGALAAAGVELGAFDVRIAEWMAGWEPHVVACIAGWVERSAAGGDEGNGNG